MHRTCKLFMLTAAVIILLAAFTVQTAAAAESAVRFSVSNNPQNGTVNVEVQLIGDVSGMTSAIFRFDRKKLTIDGIDGASLNLAPMDSIPDGTLMLSDEWEAVSSGTHEIPMLYCAADEMYGYINLIMTPTDSFSAANYTTAATVTLKVINNAVITSSDITLPTGTEEELGTATAAVVTTESGVSGMTPDIVYDLIAAIPKNHTGTWGVCNAKWALGTDGTLTVSGDGALGDGSSSIFELEALKPYIGQITNIQIDSGTSIEARAFAGGTAVESVIFPDTLERIGADAFADCPITEITDLEAIMENAIMELQDSISQHEPKIDFCYYTHVDEADYTEDYWETLTQTMFGSAYTMSTEDGTEYADYMIIKKTAEKTGDLLFVDVTFVMKLPKNGVIYTDPVENLTYTLTLDRDKDGFPTGKGTLTVTGKGTFMNQKNVSLSALSGIRKYYKLIDRVDLSGSSITKIGAGAFKGFTALETVTLPDGYYENTVSTIMTALIDGETMFTISYYEQTPTKGIDKLLMEGPMSTYLRSDIKSWSSDAVADDFSTTITFSITYLYDIVVDGKINDDDLTMLLEVLFTQITDKTASADFNGDGYIDAFDLALLVRKLDSLEVQG